MRGGEWESRVPLARALEAMHPGRMAQDALTRAWEEWRGGWQGGRACLSTMTSWDGCARSGVGCLPGLTTRPQKLLIVRVHSGATTPTSTGRER